LYTVSYAVFACCVTWKYFTNVNEPAYLHQKLPKFSRFNTKPTKLLNKQFLDWNFF
jgi:hypothetical protein